MIDLEVAVAAEHERIVAVVFISIHYAAAAYLLNRHVEKGSGANVWHDIYRYKAVTLQYPEDGDLVIGASTSLALALAAKVRLIGLDLTGEYALIVLGLREYGLADDMGSF